MKIRDLCLVFVVLFAQGIAQSCEATWLSLKSRHETLLLHLNIPSGWDGPVYKSWPTYETWSFSRTSGGASSYLEIRIKHVNVTELDLNNATVQQVRDAFRDFKNPVVEKVATVRVGDSPVSIWAVHNVDGDLFTSEVRRDNVKILFSVRAENADELDRRRRDFVSTLTSVQSD